ncbi:MAG TPA: FGGY family carbohydrate kinase [Terriglobales bacterium]|nr:FGGY family carbohydrate kinase [Terriglobales bacterium]
MPLTSCVLGIDLGTSAIKLVAVSLKGRVLASARQPYPTLATTAGQAEQNCQDWLNALRTAARRIRSRLAHAQVESIALTGQMPTLVVLRRQRPVGSAITWQDSRADEWVKNRVDADLRLQIYRATGILIDGRYLAPMFRFHHRSGQKADGVLSAKDFLFHALTGSKVTDPSTASGYGVYNLQAKAWNPELCKFWGMDPRILPAIESSSFRAPLTAQGHRLIGCALGTPVVLGCADSVAGVYAISGDEQVQNAATVLTGTSTVIMRCLSQPRWDRLSRYLLTPFALDGWYGCEADLLASGSAREWGARVFLGRADKKSHRSVWQAAYRVAPGADGLFFAPFLAGGEQGVLWNPRLRAVLSGLTLAHGGAQMARALLEGMCFEVRRCLDVLEEEGQLSFVRVAGWVADIPQELQLLADVIGRPVHAFRLDSASAVGATLLSGLIDIKTYFVNAKSAVFEPSQRSKCYDEIYAKYLLDCASFDPPRSSTGRRAPA